MILVNIIGVAVIDSLFQLPVNAKYSQVSQNSLPTENTKVRQSKIILAENSEEKTRIRIYEKASPAVV
ncbi:hypothetical protein F8S20_33480 [Nostoc sp. BAE]|nr:hypothetical protein [Nostoc commune BAE]